MNWDEIATRYLRGRWVVAQASHDCAQLSCRDAPIPVGVKELEGLSKLFSRRVAHDDEGSTSSTASRPT